MADLLEKCLKDAQPIQKKMDSNMMAIRHLDMQFHLKESETNQKLLDLVANWKKLSKDEQKQNYEQIEKCFAEAKEISNQKISIASETYEFIDNFIRRLDKDATKLNSQIRQQERHQLVNEQTPEPETGSSSSASRKRRGTMQSTSSSTQKRGSAAGRKQVGEQLSLANTYIDDDIPVTNVSSEMTLVSHGDMPVDPNEPRYCICQQVSFGSMVGCDNPKCRLEWFHFSCVGLTSSPKGKWFCPECSGGKDAKKPQPKKTPKRGKNVQE